MQPREGKKQIDEVTGKLAHFSHDTKHSYYWLYFQKNWKHLNPKMLYYYCEKMYFHLIFFIENILLKISFVH